MLSQLIPNHHLAYFFVLFGVLLTVLLCCPPSDSKDYIHRVGRTARAGRAGRAISVVTQYDVELYQRIEESTAVV